MFGSLEISWNSGNSEIPLPETHHAASQKLRDLHFSQISSAAIEKENSQFVGCCSGHFLLHQGPFLCLFFCFLSLTSILNWSMLVSIYALLFVLKGFWLLCWEISGCIWESQSGIHYRYFYCISCHSMGWWVLFYHFKIVPLLFKFW